jgi:hypothetical protein
MRSMKRLLQNSTAKSLAVIVFALTIGSACTATRQTTSNAPPLAGPSQSSATSQPTSSATEAQPKQAEPVEKPAAAESPPVKSTTPAAPKTATQPPTKAAAPIAQTPTANKTEKPATVKAVAPSANAAVAPPKPQASANPTLDLKSLEQRLRDTHAIGIMTKLSLKNHVDDLLDEFRAYYAGKGKIAIADLRQRYDLLLMKVLSVLQDEDVALASDISSSREAIWGVLQDPKKFAEI